MKSYAKTYTRSPRIPLYDSASALALAGCVALASAYPLVADAENGWNQPGGGQGIFGDNSSSYQGSDYNLLRPGHPGMDSRGWGNPRYGYPDFGPRGYAYDRSWPNVGAYGPGWHQRQWGYPYGPGPGYQQPAAPYTGIYGSDSRKYGGSDYGILRPDQQR